MNGDAPHGCSLNDGAVTLLGKSDLPAFTAGVDCISVPTLARTIGASLFLPIHRK